MEGEAPGEARRVAVLVGALALVAQLAVLGERGAADPLYEAPVLDASENWRWANAMVKGTFDQGVFVRGPLYLWLVAGLIGVAGRSLTTLYVLQAGLAALTAALAGALGTRAAGRVAGLVAGALLALNPAALHFAGDVLDATLSGLLTLVVVALALYADGGGWRAPRSLLLGLAVGALGLCRPNALVLLPILGVWALARAGWRPGLRGLAVATLGCALAVSPATAWNRVVGGDTVLVASTGGVNLYVGNRRGGDGLSANAPELGSGWWEDAFRRVHVLAEQAEGRPLRPSEVSAHWTRRALAEVAADPLAWVRLMAWKGWVLVQDVEIANNKSVWLSLRYSTLGRLPLPGFGVLLAGALAAVATGALRRPIPGLLAVVTLGWAATVVLFIVNGRYRFPMVPPLAVLAGIGWVAVARALVGKERRSALAGAAAGAALAWSSDAVDPPALVARTGEAEEGRSQLLLARHHLAMGEPAEAEAALRAAAERVPGEGGAANNLGVLLLRRNAVEEAATWFARAAEEDPADPLPLRNLAAIRMHQGRAAEAVTLLERALAIAPGDDGIEGELVGARGRADASATEAGGGGP